MRAGCFFGREWKLGLTCIDDVANSPWAQGVIERDHHHGIRVAGQLCNDPLQKCKVGVGGKGDTIGTVSQCAGASPKTSRHAR